MSKKEVAKIEEKEVAIYDDSDFASADMGASFEADDLVLPRILMMQGQSPKVLEGFANFGDIRDNQAWELLGKAAVGQNPAEPLEAVPFFVEKYWVIKKKEDGKWKYDRREDIKPGDKKADAYNSDWQEDGIWYRKFFTYMLYLIIPGKEIPYTLQLNSTSANAGAQVTTIMQSNKNLKTYEVFRRSIMGRTVQLTPLKVSKDGSTFMKLEAAAGRPSTKEEAVEALKWNKLMQEGMLKVDHSSDHEEQSSKGKQGEF